jgi:predicted AAA+ superfamily ATPase
MISRKWLLDCIRKGVIENPGVVVLGPRQCGKTTLARQVAAERDSVFFDLENPDDLSPRG